jgi:CHAD domain-containing protein
MSQTIQMADSLAKAIGLETWMLRVLERADKVADGWGEDDIHDLRVALRRCRTMADALSRVNPDGIWRKVKKSTRDVFRALGELRDTQMERVWLKKLWPGRDPVRARLMRELLRREVGEKEAARKALAKFDRKGWKKWARKIAPKAGFFPPESVVFQRLALSELNGCAMLFGRARKGPSAVAWHRARIGLKRFRYITENFLPRRYEACAREVKRLQDLLGEVHDLDVLKADARKDRERAAFRGGRCLAGEDSGRKKDTAEPSGGPDGGRRVGSPHLAQQLFARPYARHAAARSTPHSLADSD